MCIMLPFFQILGGGESGGFMLDEDLKSAIMSLSVGDAVSHWLDCSPL